MDEYLRIGLPDPGRFWTATDYRACRDILYHLNQTNRAAVPRLGSPKSGAVFARLVNPTNTLLLADRFLPARERMALFYAILNRLPAFQTIYRYDTRQPVLHREVIELDHAFLRMLRQAVEWDGKPLPLSAGEVRPVTFRLAEFNRSYEEGRLEGLLGAQPRQYQVPRGGRFVFVGAYGAATFSNLLPWLADGTGLPEAERLKAIGYLRQDVPALWPHFGALQKQELLGELDAVRNRTRHGGVRSELDAFRQELAPR